MAEEGIVPTSMIDLSDGLSSDLMQICKASKCGARIYLDRIPIARQTYALAEEMNADPVVAALNGGEDHELLFTVPLALQEQVMRMGCVDLRGVFGENELFREFLRNYEGVRLRMEFFQFGILNKNKYIVELVHRDPEKTIPLYISTDGTGIYQIWYYYAKRLNMPTVIDTDEGTVKREVPELDKSLKEYLFAKGLIAV